jgi:hypothetical protein
LKNSNISNNDGLCLCACEMRYHISYRMHCYIENNIATSYVCMGWIYENKQSYIDNSNIINNSQNSDSSGLIHYNTHYVTMRECSIINNRGNNRGTLFSKYSSGSFTIINVYIDWISFHNPGGDYVLSNPLRFYFVNTNDISNIYTNTILQDCIYHNYYDYNQFNKYFIQKIDQILKKNSCNCKTNNNNFSFLSNHLFFLYCTLLLLMNPFHN